MPQPRSGGSRSRSGARSQSRSGAAKRTTKSSSASSRGARSGGARRTTSRSASSARSSQGRATRSAGSDAQLEAAAERLRKLNERIITAGKDAGETTLSNYEKALKAIASAVERGPGSSDVEWIANLANAQAKFIRDVTKAWTSAARGVLK
jgi:hypothetical protein